MAFKKKRVENTDQFLKCMPDVSSAERSRDFILKKEKSLFKAFPVSFQ